MQSSSYANSEYYTNSASSHHHYQSHHPHHSTASTGSAMPAPNSMQYWPSPQHQHQQPQSQPPQQHSPNQVTNFGNSGTYHQTGEPVYSLHQQTNATSNVYAGPGSHTNYGTINETQDIYQYSPYSGDLLQPEEIFQLDQPIRSANVSSLNGAASTASSSPPATLLDLGSGTIEQKPIIYVHNDLTDPYYNVHDENSTNSSHNNDTNCYYQSINESIHLNNNNNNSSMVSMNAHHLDATNSFASSNYYCDARRYSKQSHSFSGHADAHSPTLHSPTDQQICMDFQNAAVMNYSTANITNNNNNQSPNNNSNFKGHKRKATDLVVFANAQQQQYGAFNPNPLHSTEYYGSDEHIDASNLELHHSNNNGSPIMSEYCNGGGGSSGAHHQYVTYFNGGESGHDLAQLANNYQISVVNNWKLFSWNSAFRGNRCLLRSVCNEN